MTYLIPLPFPTLWAWAWTMALYETALEAAVGDDA